MLVLNKLQMDESTLVLAPWHDGRMGSGYKLTLKAASGKPDIPAGATRQGGAH